MLEFIAKKEGLQLPSGFATRVAEKSNRSLRRAILSFETCRVQQLSSLTPFINQWQFHVFLSSFSSIQYLKMFIKPHIIPYSYAFCGISMAIGILLQITKQCPLWIGRNMFLK